MRRSSGAAYIFGATGVDFGFNLRPRGIQLPAYHFFSCFTLRHSTSLPAIGLRPTN